MYKVCDGEIMHSDFNWVFYVLHVLQETKHKRNICHRMLKKFYVSFQAEEELHYRGSINF